MRDDDALLHEVAEFRLFDALQGRRARRFARGAEIPRGPLAHRSRLEPVGLDDLERSILIAAGIGVSGWHFGIPYTESEPGLCTYSARFTGRTVPTGAGIGTAELIYTDDSGTFFVSSRDAGGDEPDPRPGRDGAAALVERCRRRTRRLSDGRIELPRTSPHYSDHNVWNANVPGSTLFVPVTDVAQQLLGFLFVLVGGGFLIWDDLARRPAGELDRFVRAGLTVPERRYPLTYLEQYLLSTCAMEMSIMCHNMALALQAMGLGGWMFTGINPASLLGAAAAQGVPGLGFRFQRDERWAMANPVGLDGIYESFCPPYHSDMAAAVQAFVALKFGPGGAYDPATSGPFRDNARVKAAAERPTGTLVEAVTEVASYVWRTYGKFPGTVPTLFVRAYTQAHHLDVGFYEQSYGTGALLDTHRAHMERWHPGSA